MPPLLSHPATLVLTLLGEPILRDPALPIPAAAFGTPELRDLVEESFVVLDGIGHGVGLAGPQVGVSYAYFVTDCRGLRVAICNPTLFGQNPWAPQQADFEGCLSVPGLVALTPRQATLGVRGFDVEGNPIAYRGSGLLARLFAHEVDHLRGHLYLDRALPGTLRYSDGRSLVLQQPERPMPPSALAPLVPRSCSSRAVCERQREIIKRERVLMRDPVI